MKNLNGVAAIVTGGGSGLGAATARDLAEAGCSVSLWDMDSEAAQSVAADIGGFAVSCDVTSAQSVTEALRISQAEHGVARILVNCAGILCGQRIVGKDGPADLDVFNQVIQVNLLGTFNTMRLVADAMSSLDIVTGSGERGIIINTASIAAFEGQIGQAAYAASKGGVVAMTLPAARELARFGIRVMAIAPGAVATPMMNDLSEEIKDSITATIPFPPRFAQPQEFSSLVMHIIENEMLNGEVIRLDGASRLAAK
ncbi:MAG: 3-hydroxyacyl-CoA dehydrogenase [Zetaproteobacteria bacterium]|nr:MAG: 3-hydroxyacyl-CoA dehydrogenase [Zetaproteobacteria bacterium]